MLVRRGVLGSVLVLLGGLLVAVLPESTPLLRIDVVADLRGHLLGRMLGLTVVMAGLGVLGAQWLALCRRVRRGDPADVSLVQRAALAWSLPLLVAPALFSRDGWSYAAQGMLSHLGRSPYQHGPGRLAGPITEAVDPRWLDTPAPYGPLPLALGGLVSGVTAQPWLLVIAHRCFALVGLVLLAWAVPRLAARGGAHPALATALACASPLVVAHGVAGLHNDLLMAGLMAAALVVATEHGWLAGSVLAGLAVAVKAPAGLICVAIAVATLPAAASVRQRLSRVVGSGAVALAVVVGLGGVSGLGVGWVTALGVPGSIDAPLSVTTIVGRAVDWAGGLEGDPARDLLRLLGTLVALAVAGWLALGGETGTPRAGVRAAATALGTLVLLSPVVHLWYLLWVLPFLAALELRRTHRVLLVSACVVGGLVAPLDSSLHGAYAAIVTGVGWAVVVALALLATRAARERLHRITADLVPVEGP